MGLTAEQKELIMASRGVSKKVMHSKSLSWQVTLEGSKPFTYITDQCRTPEEVEKAMAEKFGAEILELKLL